ncbi:Serpentine Receptor, class E (Epsilon) [Caenorhabditis elegans]|uniref:Serpentine Receptor, class E (Epsilon) n=1 Tax=Caenorhabditis elegans TaxID=6239 RepID=A3QMA1_CAEEL|nr:Serpentine Receptor, class E (Epsilon) [Caenorhabditis elegans]CAM36333.1 Serpentine Receptor, class E (Epsilon) [Caenorhabditis elegans]|eukprot:NP_496616.2 Serpentine Receptor, class E (epsilon) [Caenorhabditis elegans]
MIFLLKNSSFSTIWLPIYTLNDSCYTRYFYRGLLLAELLLSILALIYSVISGYIILTTKAFHTNFNTLLAIIVLSWKFSIIGKIFLIPYSTGIFQIETGNLNSHWWTDDVTEMITVYGSLPRGILVGGVATWYYMILMSTCLFILSLERTFASIFIKNYENTRRLYLLFLIILFQQFMVLSIVYLLTYNLMKFINVLIFLIAMNFLPMLIFLGNRWFNLKIVNEFLERPEEAVRNYTLPVRFQAKENLRVFNLTVRVTVVGFIAILFALLCIITLTLEWVPSLDTFLIYCFENIVHLNPLVICPVLILSVSTWSKSLLSTRLPLLHKLTRIALQQPQLTKNAPTQQQETDTYFSQLQNVWEQKPIVS